MSKKNGNKNGKELPPTLQRLLDMLRNGEPVHHSVLRTCYGDELANKNNLSYHIWRLNLHLRVKGLEVSPCFVPPGGRLHYKLRRLLASPYRGYK